MSDQFSALSIIFALFSLIPFAMLAYTVCRIKGRESFTKLQLILLCFGCSAFSFLISFIFVVFATFLSAGQPAADTSVLYNIPIPRAFVLYFILVKLKYLKPDCTKGGKYNQLKESLDTAAHIADEAPADGWYSLPNRDLSVTKIADPAFVRIKEGDNIRKITLMGTKENIFLRKNELAQFVNCIPTEEYKKQKRTSAPSDYSSCAIRPVITADITTSGEPPRAC